MALTIDWANRLVLATESITDIVLFKEELRAFEESDVGLLYPPIITYKRLDLGGGAYMHGVDFINSYRIKFPLAGNYVITGNIGADIVTVPGVYVDRTKAAAYATVSGTGGVGITVADIRAELAKELALVRLIPALL